MKQFLTSAAMSAAIALLSCSCDRTSPIQPEVPTDRAEVEITIDGLDISAATRAADLKPTPEESAYSSAMILVYDKQSGVLESYKPWTGGPVSFTLDKGEKVLYAVLNAGSDINTRAGSISALLSNTATLKGDLGGFFMMGKQQVTVSGKASFSITVRRAAAKIVFNDVKLKLDSPALAAQSFTVNAILVINAAGDISYSALDGGQSTYSPTVWYNRQKYVSGDCNRFLYVGGLSKRISNENTIMLGKTLYTYPNYITSDSHASTWSPRKTRVCLECTIGSETVYYPITLSEIGPNKLYTINTLTITKKGVTNPDDEWDDASASGAVIVDDWYAGLEITETM